MQKDIEERLVELNLVWRQYLEHSEHQLALFA